MIQKRFPMQHGPDIDWVTAERIYAVYAALYGREQSLQRLAERGGFGWAEVQHLIEEGKNMAFRCRPPISPNQMTAVS